MPTIATLTRHIETHMGLPYPITLVDSAELTRHPGFEVGSRSSNDVWGIAVPQSEKLAIALAVARCFQPVRLTEKEVHFLRRVLGMNVAEFGKLIGRHVNDVEALERDTEQLFLTIELERTIRQAVLKTLCSRILLEGSLPANPDVEARSHQRDNGEVEWTVTWK